MPTPKKGPRLGAGPAHQKLMLANLAGDLFRHGRIRTTHAKAKTLRPYAERLITRAKRGDLASRRLVQAKLGDRDVVHYLFEDVAPRFSDRPGGYTRILKLGPRPGDNAPMALIELVEQSEESGHESIEEGRRQRTRGIFGRGRRQRATEDVGYDDLEYVDDDHESLALDDDLTDGEEPTSEDSDDAGSDGESQTLDPGLDPGLDLGDDLGESVEDDKA